MTWPRFVLLGGLMLAAYGATLVPWMLRNKAVVGAAVLSTQGGIAFYSSHFRNPGQPYGVLTQDETTRQALGHGELAESNTLTQETLRRLRAQPSIVLRAIPEKLFWFFVPFDWEVIAYRVFNPTYFVTVILLLLGLRSAFRTDRAFAVVCLAPLVYLALMSIAFYGSPRFRLPAEPMLAPLAAMGAMVLVSRRRPSAGVAQGDAASMSTRTRRSSGM